MEKLKRKSLSEGNLVNEKKKPCLLIFVTTILFFSFIAISSTCLGTKCSFSGNGRRTFQKVMNSSSTSVTSSQKIYGVQLHDIEKRRDQNEINMEVISMEMARRLLSGPGSSPPRCISKCGRCSPCKPVHVPVPPGTPITAEYYPEAWRCKCGNKLYMP